MSYLQQFGVSRISPLNLTEREKPSKEELLNMMTVGVDQNPNIDPATKIIEKNNNKSEAGLGGGFGKFFTKEAVKHGLKKYVGPLASKAFGLASMMLTTQSAYARPPGEFVDGEYIQQDDFENPKFSQTSFGKRYQNLVNQSQSSNKEQQVKKAKEKGIKTIMDPNY